MAQAAAAQFVSDAAMEATAAARADFAGQLADLGFLSPAYARACADGTYPLPPEAAAFDDMSGNARIVKAALCAGFYPSILRVEHPAAVFAETHGGAVEKDADPKALKFYDRRRGAPAVVCLFILLCFEQAVPIASKASDSCLGVPAFSTHSTLYISTLKDADPEKHTCYDRCCSAPTLPLNCSAT